MESSEDVVNAILSLDLKLDNGISATEALPDRSEEKKKSLKRYASPGVRRVGSRRHNRWMNRRYLEANLRRLLYESGEDVMESDLLHCQTVWLGGRKVNVGIGAKDIPLKKIPSYWTRLRQDFEACELFRHREDYHIDHALFNSSEIDLYNEDPEYSIQRKLEMQQAMLELKIYSAFRGCKKVVLKRVPFVIRYLEGLEQIFFQYLEEWKATASVSSTTSLERNIFRLEGCCYLRLIPRHELNEVEQEIRKEFPDCLLLWNLTGIHRKMTYLLCSVWNLLCHSRIISNSTNIDSPDHKCRRSDYKVVIIPGAGIEIPVFPVAMNLLNVLTKPANGTLRIRTVFPQGSDADSGLLHASLS